MRASACADSLHEALIKSACLRRSGGQRVASGLRNFYSAERYGFGKLRLETRSPAFAKLRNAEARALSLSFSRVNRAAIRTKMVIAVEDEALLFQSFIIPKKRQHYTNLLSTKRGRRKICLSLNHFRDLDPRFCKQVPSGLQRASEILRFLTDLGAPPVCHILSSDSKLDGQQMSLADALSEIVGYGMGTFLSCLPGKLAYFEGEGQNERYICHREQ